ncbi:hypothetical protein TPA0908_02520 [Micromonospora sp. AKA38]|nr:hypothetical protein TPA0908_02520 [Micromonospora sp. AKA38]
MIRGDPSMPAPATHNLTEEQNMMSRHTNPFETAAAVADRRHTTTPHVAVHASPHSRWWAVGDV